MTENPHRRSGVFMLVAAWLGIFVAAFLFFRQWGSEQFNPNEQVKSRGGEIVLEANRSGHYVASGEINGEAVTFLLDTGATQVALSSSLANRLGLKRKAQVAIDTANGRVAGYQTRLDRVKLGDIELNNIGALVTDGIRDDVVLLGMSFLKHVEFTQRGSVLILRRLPPAS